MCNGGLEKHTLSVPANLIVTGVRRVGVAARIASHLRRLGGTESFQGPDKVREWSMGTPYQKEVPTLFKEGTPVAAECGR